MDQISVDDFHEAICVHELLLPDQISEGDQRVSLLLHVFLQKHVSQRDIRSMCEDGNKGISGEGLELPRHQEQKCLVFIVELVLPEVVVLEPAVVEEDSLVHLVVSVENLVENSEDVGGFLDEANGPVVLDFGGQVLDSPESHLVGNVLVEDDFLINGLGEVVVALESPPEEGLGLVY